MPGRVQYPLRVQAQGSALLAAGILGCAAITWLSWQDMTVRSQSVPFVAIFIVLFAAYLLGVRWLNSLTWKPAQKVALVVGVAAVLRVILVPAPPLLDDDIYRYRWDGKVLASGMNPYAHAPESRALAALAEGDPLFHRIGFRDVPAVYPPASMAAFAAGHVLTPEAIWGIKALVVMSEGVIIGAILGLLRAFGRPPESAAIYAWNPLALKEFANSGHHDAIGIALLMMAFWAVAVNRRGWAASCLALAALIKPIALVAVPALWARLRPREWLVTAAIVIAAFLPFAGIGISSLFAGMGIYARHWEMNDSVFALLQAAFGGPIPSSGSGFLYETNPAARVVTLILLGAAAVYLLYDVDRERRGLPLKNGPAEGGPLRSLWRMAILLAIVLALTPTMDPWYLCWLIPFLCFFRWEAGLLMTGTAALSYLYYWQGRDPWWLRPVEYLPVVGWAVWESIRARKSVLQLSGA